jgi:cytochrome c peroxidase
MKLITLLFLFSFQIQASPKDVELAKYIQNFRLKPAKKPSGHNKVKFQLGKKLFFDKKLSGNKDISCASCHSPDLGTGDALPLPIGVTGTGIATDRVANGAPIIPRNAPHLYNISNKSFMFWDGRVSYDGFEFKTPEPGLNGESPLYSDIVAALDNALAAQALFPPTSPDEMLGTNNDFSDAKSNLEIWNKMMDRILSIKEYSTLFKAAYPNVKDFNIGHLASAIAHYEGHEFTVTNTPWDNYLRGNKDALSNDEKSGAIVFLTKGKCITCHTGSDLGGSTFHNIASPQIGPGIDINKNDEGRIKVTGFEADRYKFKTPTLRNIKESAPYFHSGAYQTLRDVVNHYARGTRSLEEYNSSWLRSFELKNYDKSLFVERNPYMLFRKKEASHPLMRNHKIRLTNPEKDSLLKFLSNGLSD